jgi:hypothetical protein
MTFNAYVLIGRAIDEGISYGLRRAYKHVDNPSEEAIQEALHRAIMDSLSEIIVWDEVGE